MRYADATPAEFRTSRASRRRRHEPTTPDRRWRRACELLKAGRRPGRGDDKPTRDALAYLRRRGEGELFPPRMAAVASAVGLRTAPDLRRRWRVEAHLLAGSCPGRIGRLVGESSAAVEAYRDLYYAVEELLAARDPLMTFLLGGRRRHRLSADDEEFFLKHYAVRGGPLVVEDVWRYYERRRDGGATRNREEKLSYLRVHAAILSHAASAEPRHLGKLIELCRLLDRPRVLVTCPGGLGRPIRPGLTVDEVLNGLSPGGPWPIAEAG